MTDDQQRRLEEKLDSLGEHLGKIDVTLAEQAVVLKVHVKRTDLLEIAVDLLKAHLNKIAGAVLLVGGLGTVAGIVDVVLRLIGK